MAKKLTDEMKRFISTSHEEDKDVSKTLRAFGDRFGYLPSSTTVEKYKDYNETNPLKEEEEEEEEGAGEGDIGVDIKDSRLEKDLTVLEGMDEADFERLCRNMNKTKHDMYNQVQEAIKRGYTKVNIATGDIEK